MDAYSSPELADSSKPLRIFIVENHADTLLWLTRYLEQCGHKVFTARTMGEAHAKLPVSNCDMLISDIGLPDGDGWELLKSLRLSRPIYAVAMSGFGMSADRARSLAAGYREHIVKPFDPDVLDSILDQAKKEMRISPL